MQDDLISSCRDKNGAGFNNGERETFHDIWQANDTIGESDDEYENTPRSDNNTKNRILSCESNNRQDLVENIDDAVANDGSERGGKCHVFQKDRIAEKMATEADEGSNEDTSNLFRKDVNSIDRDEYRMRGGCSGCCTSPHEKLV